ncbi:MAG: hypothetical protein JW714_01040 [Candidatus Omnitrophica bacterium]|nr:hypothetical protein [Candidatus Omnitrophota bacterium]
MKITQAMSKRWQRVEIFFSEIAYAGARPGWALNEEMIADSSGDGAAFFIFDPEKEREQGGEAMRRLNRKGQSTLEYVIILTAIVAAVVVGASYVRQKIQEGFGDVQTSINNATTRITSINP